MIYEYLKKSAIQDFIASAIKEDIGEGDHTSLACIPENAENTAKLIVKDDGVLAGVAMAEEIFNYFDPDLTIDVMIRDGENIRNGDIVFEVNGKARSILTTERLVLNCMQRMSAIATKTRSMSNLISHTKAKLLDTRKTTPNFRLPEKWAVKIGGGENHRYALYDMIMIKDNHVDFAGGIGNAIQAAKKYIEEGKHNLEIEVETRNLEEIKEVLRVGGIKRIMLDNMSPQEMSKAISLIDGKYETEASGGINEETIVAVAETGVDYISVGAITHSYKSLDLSLKAI